MENVTDRTSNPFGMRPPGDSKPVHGYGDANADFHVVGDHPGVHGGADTGVPFTGSRAGRAIQRVLHEVGLLPEPYSDEPRADDVFFSYLHLLVPGPGGPTAADYRDMEAFFDAELRAVTAHVLVPVGERAIRTVLERYTARRADDIDVDSLHATEVATGAWLVVPVKDPADWTDADEAALVERFRSILSRDYRRETDLGRFTGGGEPYYVR